MQVRSIIWEDNEAAWKIPIHYQPIIWYRSALDCCWGNPFVKVPASDVSYRSVGLAKVHPHIDGTNGILLPYVSNDSFCMEVQEWVWQYYRLQTQPTSKLTRSFKTSCPDNYFIHICLIQSRVCITKNKVIKTLIKKVDFLWMIQNNFGEKWLFFTHIWGEEECS